MVKTRTAAKQELTRVNNNINWVYKHLATFLEFGYQERDEFLKPVQAVIATLQEVEKVVEDIKSQI